MLLTICSHIPLVRRACKQTQHTNSRRLVVSAVFNGAQQYSCVLISLSLTLYGSLACMLGLNEPLI